MKNLYTKLLITLITLLLSLNISAQTVATVGISAGSFCGFTQIQTAIDSGADEVRVLNNQIFYENLEIDSSVVLKGGYPNCAAAASDQPNGITTKIDASSSGLPAIEIDTNGEIVSLFLLTFRNANVTSDGGGLEISNTSGNGLVEIFNSFISGNTADFGGGIHVNNGSSGSLQVKLNNTKVYNNNADQRGGGIHCSGNTFITVQNNSGIYLNEAGYYGGGIFADDGCSVTVSSGDDARQGLTYTGVVRNTAGEYGGGVFAFDGSKIFFQGNRYGVFNNFGNNNKPATLADNEASEQGGGIMASFNSQVEFYDTLVWGNEAANEGGGIHLDGSSTLLMTTSDKSTCWNPGKCSILAQNQSDLGGAIYQSQGATATINNSHIYQNIANWGLVIFSREDGASGTSTQFHNNMIYKHGNGAFDFGDRYLFRGFEPVTMELIHNTIANNDVASGRSILGASQGASFTVKNSIIYNSGETVYSENSHPDNDIDADCLVVNEQTSFNGTNISSAFVSYVDSSNDDYHLTASSLATDRCAGISGFTHDIDGEPRGFDDPRTNTQGTYDAGADETYASDVIFKHGFE